MFTYLIELLGSNSIGPNISFLYQFNLQLPSVDTVITKEYLLPMIKGSFNINLRNQFTSSEDNLILRGVNLCGEKEWLLISDKFLPDRSVSITSQRYSRMHCLFCGVQIDLCWNLPTLPVIFDDNYNEKDMVKAPLTYNMHR